MSWDVMQGVVVTKKCSKEDGGVDFSCEDQDISDLGKGQDNSDSDRLGNFLVTKSGHMLV
jgi:hypothetical protein